MVGAGLAGITAAFAAHQLDATVSIFESKSVPLHLQRGSELRFIHPHILDWPAADSETLVTQLPCMNWGADMASRVSNTVLEEWLAIEDQLDTNYECEVRSIEKEDDGQHVLLAEGKGRNIVERFDLVILAVGFGLERSLPGSPLLSYWENDNYGRPIVTGVLPRHYLVTGCGDGGLIDAIRLRINAFDHADFVYGLQTLRDIGEIKRRLPEIDQEVQAELASGKPTDNKEETAGLLLERKYRQLDIPSSLKDLVTRQLREDTVVFLNSPFRTPYSLKASILNRFLTFLLREYGGLRYRAGAVAITAHPPPHGFSVSCTHEQFPAEHFHVHEVVVRHGPLPIIDTLVGRELANACRSSPGDLDDPTRHRMYPDDFLARDDLQLRKRQIALEYSLSNAGLAAKGLISAQQGGQFGIETMPGETPWVRYFVSDNVNVDPSATRENDFYEFAVIRKSATPPAAGAGTVLPALKSLPISGKKISAKGPRLRRIGVGDGIAILNRNESFTRATIGCFVRLSDTHEVGLLTAGHVLGGANIDGSKPNVWFVDRPLSTLRAPIARVARVALPVPSAPKASLAAGNAVMNKVDAGVAVLSSGIQWNASAIVGTGRSVPLKLADISDASVLGKRVFKIGMANTMTYGRVRQVGALRNLTNYEGSFWYRGLYYIEPEQPGTTLSQPGDDGALVLYDDCTILGIQLFSDGFGIYVAPIEDALFALNCDLIPEGSGTIDK